MKSEPKRRRRATEDHTAHFWAFEFLKRNPEFRAALKTLAGLAGPKTDPGSPFRRRWQQISDEFGVRIIPPKQWALDLDSPVLMTTAPAYVPSFPLGQAGEYHHVVREKRWALVLAFDLQSPTTPQLARAKWLIDANRRGKGIKIAEGMQRDRSPDFAQLLRVLDLRAEGKSWSKIAEEVFPQSVVLEPVDRVKKLFKRAKRLRDGGYRHLATVRQKPGFLSSSR